MQLFAVLDFGYFSRFLLCLYPLRADAELLSRDAVSPGLARVLAVSSRGDDNPVLLLLEAAGRG